MTTSAFISLLTFIAFCAFNIVAGLIMVASKTLTTKLITFIVALAIGWFFYEYQDVLFRDLNDYIKLIFSGIDILNK